MTSKHNSKADDIHNALCVMYGNPIKPPNIPEMLRIMRSYYDPIKPAKVKRSKPRVKPNKLEGTLCHYHGKPIKLVWSTDGILLFYCEPIKYS